MYLLVINIRFFFNILYFIFCRLFQVRALAYRATPLLAAAACPGRGVLGCAYQSRSLTWRRKSSYTVNGLKRYPRLAEAVNNFFAVLLL